MARRYSDVTQIALAKRLKIDPSTLGRWEKGTDKSYKRNAMIEAAANATKLPREFFVIDFKDLPAMMQAWRQAQGVADGDLAMTELETELEEESRRSGPSEKRSEGSTPGSGSR